MLCQDCPKKPTCIELCERAEKYVNKDYISLRESTHLEWMLDLLSVHVKVIHHNEIKTYFTSENVSFPFLSDLQNNCLHLFYFEGLTYKEIAFRLSIANQYGVYLKLSSEGASYQLRSAKHQILQSYIENKGIN